MKRCIEYIYNSKKIAIISPSICMLNISMKSSIQVDRMHAGGFKMTDKKWPKSKNFLYTILFRKLKTWGSISRMKSFVLLGIKPIIRNQGWGFQSFINAIQQCNPKVWNNSRKIKRKQILEEIFGFSFDKKMSQQNKFLLNCIKSSV